MNPDASQSSGGLPDEDPLLGEPITALNELEQNTSPRFLGNVRKKIFRRMAASEFASFSWQIPRIISIEFVGMLVEILSAFGGRKKEEKS
jgi:hypothetical protein